MILIQSYIQILYFLLKNIHYNRYLRKNQGSNSPGKIF